MKKILNEALSEVNFAERMGWISGTEASYMRKAAKRLRITDVKNKCWTFDQPEAWRDFQAGRMSQEEYDAVIMFEECYFMEAWRKNLYTFPSGAKMFKRVPDMVL